MRTLVLAALCTLAFSCKGNSQNPANETTAAETAAAYPVTKSDAEWQKELTPLQYYILRKAGTENPGTSEWLKNKAEGTYVCAGCGTPVFKSEHKFESGTGWPSFDREIEGNVAFTEDRSYGMIRVEEHCATCGGHLGHVFEDGPRKTTGMRHCINGAALNFIPSE